MSLRTAERAIILFSMFLLLIGVFIAAYQAVTFDKNDLPGYSVSVNEYSSLCSQPGIRPLVSQDEYYVLTRTNHSVSSEEVYFLLNNCLDVLDNVVSKDHQGFSISLNNR